MGEAAGKIERPDPSNRVTQLESAIARKRQELTQEVNELKRRGESAKVTAVKAGKLIGLCSVVALCAVSIVNAVSDAFKDEEQIERERGEVPEHPITRTLSELAIAALKAAAVQFARTQLERIREEMSLQQREQQREQLLS